MYADMPELPAEVSTVLAAGEQPVAFTWAEVAPVGTPGTAPAFVHLVIAVVDLVRSRLRMRRVCAQAASAGFPLDRRMALLVSSRRLLVWSASGFPRRIRELLSERPLSSIASATLPYTGGGGWRTIAIELAEGIGVRIQIQAQAAEKVVSALDGHRRAEA